MTHHKKYDNESQDARRRDKHNEVHPDDKIGRNEGKSDHPPKKPSDPLHPLRK